MVLSVDTYGIIYDIKIMEIARVIACLTGQEPRRNELSTTDIA